MGWWLSKEIEVVLVVFRRSLFYSQFQILSCKSLFEAAKEEPNA